MTEYTISFSGLLQQPSPLEQTQRNLRISAGDDFALVVTMYADEDASTPVSIKDSVPTLYLYRADRHRWGWDYGFGAFELSRAVLQVVGTVATTANPSGGALGQMAFALPPSATSSFAGRFVFLVRLVTIAGNGAVVVRGVMDIAPSIYFPVIGSGGEFTLDISDLDGPDVMG